MMLRQILIPLLALWIIGLFGLNTSAASTTIAAAEASDFGVIEAGNAMNAARALHTATLLQDGRVLITGGMVEEGDILASTELYNVETGEFTPAADLITARVEHTATLLDDGRVLIAGGWGRDVLDSAELYDPTTSDFREIAPMTSPRAGFTATKLHDGQVLIIGGYDNGTREFLLSAELFDPATETFTPVGEMSIGRLAHTATLLENGQVLIAGGGTFDEVYQSAELYDPETQTFHSVGELLIPRYKHAAALLPDGSVLLIGGSDARDWNGQYTQVERFDPQTETFQALDALNDERDALKNERFKFRDAVAVLSTGQILIAGGNETVELYEPKTEQFSVIEGRLDDARYYATATLLAGDQVLITGGYARETITATASTWVFSPSKS